MDNPIITVYNAIATLLRAEPTFFDKQGRSDCLIVDKAFTLFSGERPFPQQMNQGLAKYPEAILDEGTFVDTAFTKWQTFGSTSQGGCNWKEMFTQVYTLQLTMPDMRLELSAKLLLGACKALRKGGPRLGLPDIVQGWGPITITPPTPTNSAESGGAKRRLLKALIPVSFLFDGQDLIA